MSLRSTGADGRRVLTVRTLFTGRINRINPYARNTLIIFVYLWDETSLERTPQDNRKKKCLLIERVKYILVGENT